MQTISLFRGILLSAASAALLALCLPGVGLGWIAFFALVPWAIATARAARRIWLVDWAFTASFLAFTVWWIGYVSWVGAFFTILVESSLMLPLGWLYRRLLRWMPATLALPLAWCAIEFLRTRYPYGGVPFSILGYALYRNPEWIQGAAALGATGISFFLAACSGLLVDLWGWRLGAPARFSRRARIAAAGLVMALGLWSAFPFPYIPLMKGESAGPRIVAVQPSVLSLSKGEDPNPDAVFEKHLRLSSEGVREARPDLLVWPETMFPWPLSERKTDAVFVPGERPYTGKDALQSEEALRAIVFRDLLPGARGAFLFGTVVYAERNGTYQPHNSALLFDRFGRRAGLYHKIHLVPGGEFVPNLGPISWLAEQLSGLEGFRGSLGVLNAGEQVEVFELATPRGAWKFTPSICYDNAYANVYREGALRGADFHVLLSNEDWYRRSGEMDQLLAASVFRAIETRRPFLRVTNSGISAWIDHEGRILKTVNRNGEEKQIEGILDVEFPIRAYAGHTAYVRWGELPWWVACALALLFALLPRKKVETQD